MLNRKYLKVNLRIRKLSIKIVRERIIRIEMDKSKIKFAVTMGKFVKISG
jgi:hypothetical protein